jgi:hypothetical protein
MLDAETLKHKHGEVNSIVSATVRCELDDQVQSPYLDGGTSQCRCRLLGLRGGACCSVVE